MPFSPLRALQAEPAVVSSDTAQKSPPPAVHTGENGAISIQIQKQDGLIETFGNKSPSFIQQA